ncbi:TIGR03862 family flavoprotein [Methylomarinum vadi]|uniref:TIGR03862 family flavoprotein n=1 Tax=Methylomarinum vadi TaxID=438855 RepID=UPI00190FB97E|nr:TIGR03862 family flavoprotein [Methylomarinum vadi]
MPLSTTPMAHKANSDSIAKVAVIGGGPAGLMAAEVLSRAGVRVDLYEAMPSVGRKFLMAGKGGMNISHSESFERFVNRYRARRQHIEPLLKVFGPEKLRVWVHGLGIDTFVGTSGRVFPTDMKAAPLLRVWLHRLRESGVRIHVRHRWLGWHEDGKRLRFATANGETVVSASVVVMALGGGSWAKLGSNGAWVPQLRRQGIAVEELEPCNCGFEAAWSDHFRSTHAGRPLKNVAIAFTDSRGRSFRQRGEFILTVHGVEGSLIYALSGPLRDEIAVTGHADIVIDLAPDQTLSSLINKLSRPHGKNSLSNFLRKRVGLKGVKAALFRELAGKDCLAAPDSLAISIKSLPMRLIATRPLDEAISSAGGVAFKELNEHLMLRSLPGVFCVGEMLDWEAPTGGYLLTACFASGFVAGRGALRWLKSRGWTLEKRVDGG